MGWLSLITVLIVAVALLAGCKAHTKPVSNSNPTPRIEVISDTLARNTDEIDKAANAKDFAAVKTANNNNRALIGQLQKSSEDVALMQKESDEFKKRAAAPQVAQAGRLNWLIIFSIVGVGISVALVVAGNKLAACGVVAGAAIIGLSMFAQAVSPLLPWAVGALFLMGIAFLVRRVFFQKRANHENVKLIEKVKPLLSEKVCDAVFGAGGLADAVQSPSTKAIVDTEQASMEPIVEA